MKKKQQGKGLVPRLRLPEFEGEWEEKKLIDILSLEYGSSLPEKFRTNEGFPVVGSNGIVGYHKTASVTGPVIVIGRKGSVGQINLIETDCTPIDTTFYIVLKQPERYHFYFIYRLLEFARLDKFYDTSAVPGLNRNYVYMLRTAIPSYAEQQRIADCLSSLDDLIAAEGRKLEALRAHKKGLMQQLFPREGETEPRLRFPEFRDAEPWKVKRLGALFFERSERGSNEFELLSVTISDGVVRTADLERKNNSNADLSNYKKVYPGDIVYNSMRMWQGASGVSWWHGVVSPAYTVVTPNESQNVVFWAYTFKLDHAITKFARFSQGITSDTWNLKYPAFSAIEMAFPSEQAEQQRIADCLSSLDDLIAAQASKVELLKQHKKGLMQQLFPVMEEAGG